MFVLTRRDVHLLARVANIEPGEVVFAVGGHGAGCQAEGFAVECGGVVEGTWRDQEVDVGNAGDHVDGEESMTGVVSAMLIEMSRKLSIRTILRPNGCRDKVDSAIALQMPTILSAGEGVCHRYQIERRFIFMLY